MTRSMRALARLWTVLALVVGGSGQAAPSDTVRFTVTPGATSIAQGSTGTQTITVTNAGPFTGNATAVVATYTPPGTSGVTVNSVTAAPGGACTLNAGNYICPSVATLALNASIVLSVNLTVSAAAPAGATAGSRVKAVSAEYNPGSGSGESLFSTWGAAGNNNTGAIGDAFWFGFDGNYNDTGNKTETNGADVAVPWPATQLNPPGAYSIKADQTGQSDNSTYAPFGSTAPTTQPGPRFSSVVTTPPTVAIPAFNIATVAANNRRVWEVRTGVYLNAASPLYACVTSPDDAMYVAIDGTVRAQANTYTAGTVTSANATPYAAGYHEVVYRIVNRNNQSAVFEQGAGGFGVLGIGTTAAGCSAANYTALTGTASGTDFTVSPSADLAADKSAPLAAGSNAALTYTVRVWNNGPSSVTGASVSDALPAGYVVSGVTCAATGTATCNAQSVSGGVLSATTGSLTLDTAPGNSVPDGNYLTYTVTGTAPASGSLSNTARIDAPSGASDPVPGNNASLAATTRIVDAVNDAGSVTSAGGAVNVLGNDTVGGGAATTINATVTLSNPGGLSGLSVNASGQLVVPASSAPGTYTVTYTLCDKAVGSACDAATAVITVTPVADVSVSKSGPATALQGNTVTYTLTVSSAGPNTVSGTTFSDAVTAGLSNVSASCGAAAGGAGGCSVTVGAAGSGGTPVTGTLGTLPSGGSQLITVSGTVVSDPGTLSNSASVSVASAVTDPNAANNTSAVVTTQVTANVSCTTLYELVGGDFTTASNGLEIRSLNDLTNVTGSLVARIPSTTSGQFGNSATLAVLPGGSKFFVARDQDKTLLVYDVATNAWITGGTFTSSTARLVRMAITSDGKGYAMDGGGALYTFQTAAPYTVSAATTLSRLPATAPAFGGSGDFFADNRGHLFLLSTTGANYFDFWEIEPATGLAIYLGQIADPNIASTNYGGFGATPSGLYGRSGTGRMVQVNLASLAVTPVGAVDAANGSTDLASCTYPAFSRSITAQKSVSKVAGSPGSAVIGGDTLEYTIVIRNGGTIATGSVTLQDSIPAGSSYVAGSTTLNAAAVADVGGAMPYAVAQGVSSPGQGAGTLLADQTPADPTDREAVVRFRVSVNTSPVPASVSNQGTVTYRDGGAQTLRTDDPVTAAAADATVTAVTPVPAATNDVASTAPSATVNILVLNNDVAASKVLTSLLFPVAGQPSGSTVGGAGKVLTTAQGTYTIKTDGSVDFTPALGFTGSASPVLYTYADSAGQTSNAASITVTVSNIVPPTASNDSAATPKVSAVTLEGATNDVAGSLPIDPASAVFPASGQPGTAVITNAGKTLSVSGQGVYSAQPNGTVIFTPAAGFAGAATPVLYTVRDTAGTLSNAATLSVTVTNQPPVATTATNAAVTSTDPAAALTPGAGGSDPDGSVVGATITTLPTVTMGTLYCSGVALGSVPSACLPAQLSFRPSASYDGAARFQYTVTDDNGAVSAAATYTIPVNRPPVATNDVSSTNPGVPVTFSVTANDSDVAPGTLNLASVVFDASSAGTVGSGGKTLVVSGQGTYTANADGTVTFSPVAGFTSGSSSARYTVRDNQGALSNVASITVTVPASVDLAVTVAGPAYFKPGQILTYTLSVTSSGAAASGVTVTDSLPGDLTFVGASAGGSYSSTGGRVTWLLGTVAPGSSTTLTLTAAAPSAATTESNLGPASLTNPVSVAANEAELVTSNNSASTTAGLIYPKLGKLVRNVTRSSSFSQAGTGKPGDTLEYCLSFRNYGVAVANFRVSDVVPSNTTAALDGYGAGLGLQVTRGAVSTRTSTASDTDGGRLSSTDLALDLGTLTAGEQGSVCFRAAIR